MSAPAPSRCTLPTTPLSAPPPRFYRRWQRVLNRSGVAAWLGFSVHRYILAERGALRLPARQPGGIIPRHGAVADLEALAAMRPEPAAKLQARFAAGHWCLAAWSGSHCVAYLWAAPGPAELRSQFGCRWLVPREVVWIYDLYTTPGLIGAFAHLNRLLGATMGDPWHTIAGQVEIDNRASRAAHASLGFREVGTIRSWHLGPCHWHCLRQDAAGQRRWRWGWAAIAPADWLLEEGGS